MIFRVNSQEMTEAVGRRLAARLLENNKKRAFIALVGEMGVGKTVFTRGFAGALGISGVKSPTYTIVNEHRGEGGIRIYHFDLYRIESADDLESIGYYDYIESDGFSIVEWPSHAEDDIPEGAIFVTISRVDGDVDARDIEISGIDL